MIRHGLFKCYSSVLPRRYSSILCAEKQNAFWITLNRPEKRNATNDEMYCGLINGLEKAAKSPCSLTVLTGTGDYFTSGNDFSMFKSGSVAEWQSTMQANEANAQAFPNVVRHMLHALIDHPTPVAAVVNGAAVGLGVTLLGLCEAVIAADHATFHTPFTALGIPPEGCSTVTFPRIMGYAKACQILLLGEKVDAAEAHRLGLVSVLLPSDGFAQAAAQFVDRYAALPGEALAAHKALLRDAHREALHQANDREFDRVCERMKSDETIGLLKKAFHKG